MMARKCPQDFLLYLEWINELVSKSLCPISLIEVGDEIRWRNFPSLLFCPFAQGFMAILRSFRNKSNTKAMND